MKENKAFLVGLCGRSGSGKGYVSRLFLKHGIPSVDTDLVYRKITAASDKPTQCMIDLINRFGKDVCFPDNSLNRAYLRSIVFFGDKKALSDLNAITHKYIFEETLMTVSELYINGYSIILIDAPLLFESGFNKICDYVVCVVAPEDISIRRILERDGVTREDAIRRLSTQISSEDLMKRSDSVIKNDDTDLVKSEVLKCVEDIRRAFSSKKENFPSSENEL